MGHKTEKISTKLLNFFVFTIYIFFILNHAPCLADWWHHNSFIIGEKAAGMGGAFTAISNSAAGIYYNPGGIGFAPDVQLSLSTTNYYTSTITQYGYLGNNTSSFNLTDSDLISGFFGGVVKLSTETPIYISFGIYNKDYVNLDNNIESISNDNLIDTKFVQKLFSSENEYAFAFAIRPHEKFSLGFSVALFDIKYSETQTANIVSGPYPNPDNPPDNLYSYEAWQYNSNFIVRGLEFGLGVLYKPNDYFSFGLSGKYKYILSQQGESNLNDNTLLTDVNFVPLGPNSYPTEQQVNVITDNKYDKPFYSLPYMIRAGIAFYPADFQTFSADLIYHSENKAANPFYQLERVYDFAIGSETKFFDTVALRLGIFTNNWCGDPSVSDQFVNVNFIGYTAGLAFINGSSTFSFTYMHQQSQPGSHYALDPFFSNGSNNPDVDWQTDQFALGIVGEL